MGRWLVPLPYRRALQARGAWEVGTGVLNVVTGLHAWLTAQKRPFELLGFVGGHGELGCESRHRGMQSTASTSNTMEERFGRFALVFLPHIQCYEPCECTAKYLG